MTAATHGRRPPTSDLRLASRQVWYEQLAFWRNPFGAAFTVLFSVVFLFFLGASAGNDRLSQLGNIRTIQYYVPGFLAYGVMAACFNSLAVGLVARREAGLLKRLRLAPLPTWALFAGVFGSAFLVSLVDVVLLLAIGRVAYHVQLPANPATLAVVLLVGAFCFCSLAVAVSSLIPNQDAAAPIVSIVYFILLFISGLWFPLQSGSALAKVAGYFPVRHFILAVFAPFDTRPGSAAFPWRHLLVMIGWGVAATAVALRRFRWEPRRA